MFRLLKTISLTFVIFILIFNTGNAGSDIKVNQNTNSNVENEPSITINRHFVPDPLNIVVAYNDIGNSLGISYTPDGGANWFDVQLPLVWTTGTGDPSVASDNNGNVYACFLSYKSTITFQDTSGIYVSKSLDGGRTWLTPYPVDEQKYNGITPVPFVDKCFMTVDTNSTSLYVNNIYVAWQRDNVDGANSDIFFAYSNNGGTSFTTPIKINDNPLGSGFCEGSFPFVGADGDVYVTWYDSYFQGHEAGSLFVDKSINGGISFGTDVKVANFNAPPKYTYSNTGFKAKSFPAAAADPHDSEKLYITWCADPDGYFDRRISNGHAPGVPPAPGSDWPVVERNGNNVYTVYRSNRNGAMDLYFNTSLDNGQTWQTPDIGPLDNGDIPGASLAWQHDLSSAGSYVYCVWDDYRGGSSNVFFNSSSNNGLQWGNDKQIDGGVAAGLTGAAQVESWSNYVYVVWHDLRNGMGDIYFASSGNNGLTWGTPKRIDLGDGPGVTDAHSPRIACNGTNVYVMWLDNRNGSSYQVYFNRSNNAGASWQASSVQLSPGTGYNCSIPVRKGLETSGSYVYACWEGDSAVSGQYEIRFANSPNNGITWNPAIQINTPGGNASMPYLDFENNNVYIAWLDDQASPGSWIYDVYFDYSNDNGATWQTPDINIDHLIGIRDQVVSICSDGGYVYAMWLDSRQWGGLGYDVFTNVSADSGATWALEQLVNHGSYPAGIQNAKPEIVADYGFVNVFWSDARIWGLPNVYTTYSSDNGTTWLSGPDEADIYFVRSTNGGASWGTPITVNDDATVWAQVLPWLVVKENGMIDLTYYNFRWTPVNPLFPGAEVRMAVSTNGGTSFQPSFPIQDTVVTPMTNWVGEYNGMAVLDSFVYTVFTDFIQSGNSDIYMDISVNPQAGSCFGKCGDANNDGDVNVSDAVWIINYVFVGGGQPLPVLACGDANTDGEVNVSDAVWIINYVFVGGSTPGDCSPGDPDWTDGDCCIFTP
jgi:Dockerin type I domain